MGPKILKIVLQNEGNMPYYFLWDCQGNTKNILAKVHESIPNFSEEIKKNTENVPPSPQKKNNTKNIPKQKAKETYKAN